MAIVSLMTGSFMGFISALFSMVLLNISWMAALGIWSGIGVVASIVLMAYAMAPRAPALEQIRQELAVE